MQLIILNRILKCTGAFRFLSGLTSRQLCCTVIGNNVSRLKMDTVKGRIFIYLHRDENNSLEPKLHSTDWLEKLRKTNSISVANQSIENIVDLINLLNDSAYLNRKFEFNRLLSMLDSECCLRLKELNQKTVLRILNAFTLAIPNRILELKFFHLSIDKLLENINDLNKPDLLKTVFFVGLQKKSTKAQTILRDVVENMSKEFIDELSIEELCTISHATFISSTKIHNRSLLNKIKNTLNDNLSLLKDPGFFITLTKTIRHNAYQDDNLLSTISCALFFNRTLQYYNFGGMCHILALYSDYLYYDENVLKYFTEKCISELRDSEIKKKSVHAREQLRDKDIKRFLWALSNLGYNGLDQNVIKEVIVPKIVERFHKGALGKDPSSLVEIIFFLWMLNYQLVELVPYALTQDNINNISASKTGTKDRLNQLLSLIYFENRPLFKQINVKPTGHWGFNPKLQLIKRPVLKRVLDNLKTMGGTCHINKFEVTTQIPYLNLIGITGYRKNIYKAVYIEVVDNYVSVKNKPGHLSGTMQTKLRILNGLEEALIVIDHNEIEGLTDRELQEHLAEEISLLC